LLDRGISIATAESAGVMESNGHLIFPYHWNNQLVNIKHRSITDKKFWMEKDAELTLWDPHQWVPVKMDSLIITEGEMDTLSLMEAGFNNAMSVPNGASAGTMEYFDSALDQFNDAERVILCLDGDEAGQKLEAELARRIGKHKCWRVEYPAGCKDANDVLMREGEEAVRDLIEKAAPYPISGMIRPRSIRSDFLHLYDHGTDKGMSSGWELFDALWTVKRGQVVIITGTPESGKSEWIDAMMVQMGRNLGLRFGIYSPEYWPPEQYIQKWAMKLLGKPFRDGPTERMTRDEAEWALEWIDDHATIFSPEHPSLDEILTLAEIMVMRDGVDFLLIDPWNEVQSDKPEGMSETKWIGECVREIKRFAQNHDVIAAIVAHPTKLQKETNGDYPVVMPYDISDSANWYNKADSILSIWRSRVDPVKPVDVHVQKMRWHSQGEKGYGRFIFDRTTGRYHCREAFKLGGELIRPIPYTQQRADLS
jgi:twinkle protein